MPVDLLFVEGELDAAILGALLEGAPVVERRGSKNALKPIAAEERIRTGRRVAFVRDRDFDFDPCPGQSSKPGEIKDGRFPDPLGWYWSRHEIENYLLDPAVVELAWPSVARQAYEEALVEAAVGIRFYEAARWTIGMARRALPPHYELKTRPTELEGRELAVPSRLEECPCREWALGCLETHLNRVSESLSRATSVDCLEKKVAAFTEDFCADYKAVLTWFSGKDLLAALSPALTRLYNVDAGQFRAYLRNWIMAYPQEALDVLPEWQTFVSCLRQ